MQDSRLRNGISYGLIVLFAVVLASQIPAFAGSLSLGALFRLILLPIIVLMVLLVVVQEWDRIRGGRWGLSSFYLPMAFTLPIALLVGVLMARYGESLNLVSLPVLIFIIGCYFLSIYFIIIGKGHYAVILFLLCLPLVDFVEWDTGKRWELFHLSIGRIRLPIMGAHIFIISLFGVWTATRMVLGRFNFAGLRQYIPVVFLIIYTLISLIVITYTHNQVYALNFIISILVLPLLLYILVYETVDTENKLYLTLYSIIAMVIMYTFMAHYMSYRYLGVTYSIKDLASTYGLSLYGTGSPTYNGTLLAMIIPLVIWLFFTVRDRRYVFPIIGLVFFVLLGLIMSFNRGAMLATLVGAFCMLKNRKAWLMVILLMALTIALWNPIYDYFLTRFHNIQSLGDLQLEHISYPRYQGWIAAIIMVCEKPILGVGLKNFGDFSHIFSAPYWYKPMFGEPRLVYMQDAHNLFLTVGAELGLVGLGILLWFLVMLLFNLLKGFSAVKGSRLEPLGWGFLSIYATNLVICIIGGGFWGEKSSLGFNFLCWALFALMGRFRWIGNRMNSGTLTEK